MNKLSKKLNQNGFSHQLILPAIVIVMVAAIGSYVVTKSKAAPVSSSSTTVTAATQTPLQRLTTVIKNLKAGEQANVTKNSLTVPGPISDAKARPITFIINKQQYFAYKQGSAPNFKTTPAQTAATMVIIKATVSKPATVKAHLDKASNLVDPNIALVGFSTGGDSLR